VGVVKVGQVNDHVGLADADVVIAGGAGCDEAGS
jgi:hypothetical protein